MRSIPDWHNIERFVLEVDAALGAGEPTIEVWGIVVSLRQTPSAEDAMDDRLLPKNGSEYHGREAIAKAYEARAAWDMASIEWEAAAIERAENCVAAAASIDTGHLKAIEFCIKRSKAAWLTFSGTYALPSSRGA